MLAVPGIETEIEKSRVKLRATTPGEYTNIFDGRVCHTLPCKDGSLFFDPSDEVCDSGELRIGLALGIDWFSYLRSQIAPSHTSCPMSFSVVNLPPHLRYRTSNLLLSGIMPGPKEADFDQVHHYMRVVVNELLRLWENGVVIKTPKYPNGRLVRVILVALATPKSFAAGGFPARTDAEHRAKQAAYAECTSKSAREKFVKVYATRYSELSRLPYFNMVHMIVIDPMHNLFLGLVKTHFYHIWVQNNVLRKTKELRRLHILIAEIEMPKKLGRLPAMIGEPAGGSLTADQWLIFATVVAPLVIPQIWEEFLPGNVTAHDAIARRVADCAHRKQAKTRARRAPTVVPPAPSEAPVGEGPAAATSSQVRPQRARRRTAKATEMAERVAELVEIDERIDSEGDGDGDGDDFVPDPHVEDDLGVGDSDFDEPIPRKRRRAEEFTTEEIEEDDATGVNLLPGDPGNFLKLCLAIQILGKRRVTEAELQQADLLLRAYCLELVELYGPSVIRPNHHFAIHTADSIRDYGPFQEFWTFLFERLNKVLKSYKSNNHGHGELETSFFREYHRTIQESRLLAAAATSDDINLRLVAGALRQASADDRGTVQMLAAQDHDTVQSLTQELDHHQDTAGVAFRLSPNFEIGDMDQTMYFEVLAYWTARLAVGTIHSYIALPPTPQSVMFSPRTIFYDNVIVDSNRYTASRRMKSLAESTVGILLGSELHAAEIMDIFALDQTEIGGLQRLARVRWLVPVLEAPGLWGELCPTVAAPAIYRGVSHKIIMQNLFRNHFIL
ncbi:hypothetical protein HYPSUDRAFT_53569 [Hypholoma sublateritium FD-334 SS-4]|uniref:Uncharacterized protein n=1 Tax=Hypholoma sublateritium (strain FD-334 SS-4) TaxID=945553 RepID=A0A0D2LC40_HYPSF|nr:hypothetical protein HYPSUDRAFT_53569 [Hypholoma sublateritium FD-334 SS-4]